VWGSRSEREWASDRGEARPNRSEYFKKLKEGCLHRRIPWPAPSEREGNFERRRAAQGITRTKAFCVGTEEGVRQRREGKKKQSGQARKQSSLQDQSLRWEGTLEKLEAKEAIQKEGKKRIEGCMKRESVELLQKKKRRRKRNRQRESSRAQKSRFVKDFVLLFIEASSGGGGNQ